MTQLIKPNTCYTVSPTGKFGGKHLSITPAESESYSSIQNLLYNNSYYSFDLLGVAPSVLLWVV